MVKFGEYLRGAQSHKPLEGGRQCPTASMFSAAPVLTGAVSGKSTPHSDMDAFDATAVSQPVNAFKELDGHNSPMREACLLDRAPEPGTMRRIHSGESLDAVLIDVNTQPRSATTRGHIPEGLRKRKGSALSIQSPTPGATGLGAPVSGLQPNANTDMAVACQAAFEADSDICGCGPEQQALLARPADPTDWDPSVAGDANFREAFREEFDKVLAFYLRAAQCYSDFFRVKRPRWSQSVRDGTSRERVRRNICDLYHEICHLTHFVDVNIVAVLKVLKKAKKHLEPDELIKPAEVIGSGSKRMNKDRVDTLKREVEAFYCTVFAGGDMHSTMRALLSGPKIGFPLFIVGLLLGLCAAGFMYGLHVTLELSIPDQDAGYWWRAFPCFRPFLLGALASIFWAGDLHVYSKYRINHSYILELSDRRDQQMQWVHSMMLGLAELMFVIWTSVVFLRAGIDTKFYYHGFRDFRGWCLPILASLFAVMWAASWTWLRAVGRTIVNVLALPYPRSVRFRDFFVADWLTSLTGMMGDFEYIGCYYYQSALSGHVQVGPPSRKAGSAPWSQYDDDDWIDCHHHNKQWKFLFKPLPYLWRLSQCLHMFRRTRRKLHLINAGKYVALCSSDIICIVYIMTTDSPDGAHWVIFGTSFFAKTYAFIWDILFDWGFAGHAGIPGFVPRRLTFRPWVYMLAAAYNLLARFAFTVPYFHGWPGGQALATVLATVELLRRASWSVFRMENENVNNLEKYRSVDYVPEVDAVDFA
eukprot:TRINITY_DN65602_c0_g1_i1.p1 TRINITY_DN65602_c0_g1~~TRINITY_DN65602_c0_g1_i1.p1  ORF type:complete len:757 (+),score=154.56 TRINITY_DN65602_c0_g1_i1:96-2366(+)